MIEAFLGRWHGKGEAFFPSIGHYFYEETLRIEKDAERPFFFYEQQVWITDETGVRERNSHWESGFINILEDGSLQMNNAQNNGRTEVLRGHYDPATKTITLASIAFSNDPRMVKTARRWSLPSEGVLKYEMDMEIQAVKPLQSHLAATLKRVTTF